MFPKFFIHVRIISPHKKEMNILFIILVSSLANLAMVAIACIFSLVKLSKCPICGKPATPFQKKGSSPFLFTQPKEKKKRVEPVQLRTPLQKTETGPSESISILNKTREVDGKQVNVSIQYGNGTYAYLKTSDNKVVDKFEFDGEEGMTLGEIFEEIQRQKEEMKKEKLKDKQDEGVIDKLFDV